MVDAEAVPSGLMTDLRDDALGVTHASPRLWWQVPLSLQSAYEIQFTRGPRGFVPDAPTATTGVVASGASTAVTWPFEPLRSRSVGYWRVRTRVGPGAGRFTGWSEPARVVLGPLADEDWAGAQTLWASPAAGGDGISNAAGRDDWAFIRREFTLPAGTIVGGYAYASAQSPAGARQHVYRGWCNGTHIGVGPTRSVDAPRYEVHDVTPHLRDGQANALAFQCWTQTGQQFQALLDVFYSDGARVTIVTDPSWSARTAQSTLPWAGDLGSWCYVAPSEAFDARFDSVGWREPGYRGTDFAPPAVMPALTGLVPGGSAGIEQIEHRPLSVVQTAPGQWLVDTGRELSAGVRLSLTVPDEFVGTTVELRMGEQRDADGTARYQLLAQIEYRDVWTVRAGPQVIEHWGYRTFRWLQLTADASLDLSNAVTILEQVAPQPTQIGSFSSSDPDLDAVWNLCAYTLAANRMDLYMDSTTRERDVYEADVVVQGRCEMALSRSYDIVRKSSRYLLRRPTWPTEFKFLTITTAWEEYLETGDLDALAADFDLHVAAQGEKWLGPDGLINKEPGASSSPDADIVDWPDTQRDGYVFTTVNTVVNACQYQAFVILRQVAEKLGRTADAAHYEALARHLRASMNSQLYDASTGSYYDGVGTTHRAQHASLYAASHGVADESELPKIARWLVCDGANPVRVSVYGAQWLLEALFLGGRAQDALDIMTSRGASSWLSMMETWGATQTMEAWSPQVKKNTTFSHPWATAPLNVIARYLLGVRVVEAGAAYVEVTPHPASLVHASGAVATVRGPVSVEFEQSPSYRISVTLPGNTQGILRWPHAGHPLKAFTVDAPSGPLPRPNLDGDTVVVHLSPGATSLTANLPDAATHP
ncbi:family 78 glycoside hydrolase catalytic domain [Kribbella sp. NPDC006257]|uniref:family 78 glycoside hydrolase catalytic domain n=1 Tax=Kribbella sp. NPDC006257 TaxID=3156738 RepID=UPI0033A96061